MRIALIFLAATVLAGCGKKEEAATETRQAGEESAAETAGADADVSGDEDAAPPTVAAAYFANLAGVWAEPAFCGDYTQQWVIDATSINLHEMHCAIDAVEESPNGVRVTGDCSVEGDNDGVPDTYELVLAPDGTLTIIQEGNGARYTGLAKCGSTEL